MEDDEWDDALLSELAALEAQALETQHHQHLIQNRQPLFVDPATSTACAVDAWSCRSCTLQNEASSVACTVCLTPRDRTAVAKKTVQATLSFDGTPSASVAVARPRFEQKQHQVGQRTAIVASATTASDAAASSTTASSTAFSSTTSFTQGAAGPLSLAPRHAAGEDADARTRYLDVETTVTCPQIDCEAAQYFVYPTNYSIRDYQLTIAEKALYHNTLVTLPTGLGKTLVAAVVMYNFYRWFPTGKIVFMAPTKPLVAQQIKACHEVMGIPLSDTAELQGNVPPTMRRVLWNSRRVFFCTPQSLQNDLKRGVCAAEKFVCIVVDEAHRATGNYAYCCVVQEIEAKTQFFRVLALSATPGAKFDVIQDVVTNLRISHIESRSADDSDVKKYTHVRQEEVVICRLGTHILEVKAKFMKCFTPIVQRLLRGNIIQYGDPEKLTSWYVLQAREKFRKSPNYDTNRSAESDLALLVSLLHAKSLLTGHGLSSFQDQITNWVEERKKGKMSWSKREMLHSSEFQSLELSLAASASSDSSASHPKLIKLREVLLEHFKRRAAGRSNTRAIVFTQYRASVSEIVALLRPLAPLLNVQPFIGQGASGKAKENKGQSQKVQQDIVRRFRSGDYNVLVATCIAEEGLDIGEVDLIVSFDALTSPVRMIQRMGRTGRKRVGRVIILVTEGEEQKKLARSASAAKTVSRALTTFKSKFKYSRCPRMLPAGVCPKLRELEMNIPTFHASQVGGKTAQGAVDPNLWRLSEAERAVALMKYFPPNFATSSRNRLYPVVASRKHLLRRQPRTLTRKNVGARVGYSSRSLMLQTLVRKIHNVEAVLETESDGEEDKSSGTNGNETGTAGASIAIPSDSTKRVTRREFTHSRNDRCQTNVGTGTGQPTGDASSSPRHTSTPSELDEEDKCGGSFASMNEAADTFDMHFSPQFVDLATQAVEDSERKNRGNVGDSQKKKLVERADNVARQDFGNPDTASTSSAIAFASKASEDDPSQTPGECEGPRVSANRADSLSHCMSAASPLAVTSDSRRPPPSSCGVVCHEVSAGQEDTSRSTQVPAVPRSRSIRQLQFDKKGDGDHSMDRAQKAVEIPQQESVAPDSEPELPPEKQEVSIVEDEGHSGFSFALLPTDLCTGEATTKSEMERSTAEEDPSEEASSAYSFALLPTNDTKDGGTSNDRDILAKSRDAGNEYLSVPDDTDCDGVHGANEVTIAVEDKLACNERHTESKGMTATPKKVKYHAAVTSGETLKVEDSMLLLETRTTGRIQAPLSQSQLTKAESKQVDEARCSICRESESYDDDPIVLCDGCNVAVHQFCYGISVVPSGKWFCDSCADVRRSARAANPKQRVCELCPLRGGALKRTKCGKWVHVQCFLWIPELRVENSDTDVLVLGDLSTLDQDRGTLDCSLCHSQKGKGIIQCAHKRCLSAFHVSCAAFAHYRMDQLDPPDGGETGCGTLFLAYCPLHRASRAPVISPVQPKTSLPAQTRDAKPPVATAAKLLSPSHLLTSPPSAEAKSKFKTFRRLKRKYDATQSQIMSQPGKNGSPVTTPPWQKHMRRSKRRRETSRVLAAAYIEDAAEVRGGAGHDDDEEDDYGDDYREAADDSFINDSSQLLYSQSVVSPEDGDQDQSKKKKRKRSSPDMRAIYARSLFESQSSPLLLRRGGRQLGALPSNGIIQACLTELHNRDKAGPVPPRPHSSSRVPHTAEATAIAGPAPSSAPLCASAAVIDSDEDDSATEAEPLPSFNLLALAKPIHNAQVRTRGPDEQEESDDAETADTEVASPICGVIGATRPRAGATAANAMELKGLSVEKPACTPSRSGLHVAGDAELQKKIEANRMKALDKLNERRQMELQRARLQRPHSFGEAPRLDHDQRVDSSSTLFDCSNTAHTATSSLRAHEDDSAAHHHKPRASKMLNSSVPGLGRAVTTVDLTSSGPAISEVLPQDLASKWAIFVSSTFAKSRDFPHLSSTKYAECAVLTADSLEADALLSVRVAVLFLTGQQLYDLSLAGPGQHVETSRRARTLLAMHKKVVVAVVHDGNRMPEIPWLKQLPNAVVVVRPRFDSLCAELHRVAHEELVQGYELPSPSLCCRDASDGAGTGLDIHFASRLELFRTISPLSLGSALSLSFRFENFVAKQVPVLKFNEMHWRRMLPWISESTAQEIQEHVKRNAQRY